MRKVATSVRLARPFCAVCTIEYHTDHNVTLMKVAYDKNQQTFHQLERIISGRRDVKETDPSILISCSQVCLQLACVHHRHASSNSRDVSVATRVEGTAHH